MLMWIILDFSLMRDSEGRWRACLVRYRLTGGIVGEPIIVWPVGYF